VEAMVEETVLVLLLQNKVLLVFSRREIVCAAYGVCAMCTSNTVQDF
jgi:hypothetical protein